MPKIDMPNWQKSAGKAHPISGQNDGPYEERVLGELAGLSNLGVRMEKLPPGSASSHRHWHETEDEFLMMISGELVLIEDDETLLKPGDCAAWRAGSPVAHCLKNKSDQDATYLIVGANKPHDCVTYPDHNIVYNRDESKRWFTRIDGTPIDFKPGKRS
ncbi:cupin domain-containing protein [Maritalea porphyrae]|uniref:cupin domain-containing protein n=1 Tax=Maritalea porphyrae TaxID=880732 RepID=UPI0022B03667|nr:cupin domain-containing protein [Maritalea porphyrae]MCZ4271599.1 cupin domain-containing protein [Maritalea porphyrae]